MPVRLHRIALGDYRFAPVRESFVVQCDRNRLCTKGFPLRACSLWRKRFAAVLPVFTLDVSKPAFTVEFGVCLMAEIGEMIDLCITEWRVSILGRVSDVLGEANEMLLCHGVTSKVCK